MLMITRENRMSIKRSLSWVLQVTYENHEGMLEIGLKSKYMMLVKSLWVECRICHLNSIWGSKSHIFIGLNVVCFSKAGKLPAWLETYIAFEGGVRHYSVFGNIWTVRRWSEQILLGIRYFRHITETKIYNFMKMVASKTIIYE